MMLAMKCSCEIFKTNAPMTTIILDKAVQFGIVSWWNEAFLGHSRQELCLSAVARHKYFSNKQGVGESHKTWCAVNSNNLPRSF